MTAHLLDADCICTRAAETLPASDSFANLRLYPPVVLVRPKAVTVLQGRTGVSGGTGRAQFAALTP